MTDYLPIEIMEHQDSSQCRVCLEEGASVPIFETKDSVDPEVYSKLCQCVGEKIEDILGYPRHICNLCHITLNTATRFIEQYKESQEILLKHVNRTIKLEIGDYDDTAFECDAFKENSDLVHAEIKKELPDEITVKLIGHNNKKCKARLQNSKRNGKSVLNGVISKANKRSKLHTPASRSHKKLKECIRTSRTVEAKEAEKSQPALRNSSNEQPSSLCDQCGAVFADRTTLHAHQKKIHKDEICPQCPESDHRYSIQSLREHLKITHSSVRPYVCPICGKTFKIKKTLKCHHQVVHEGMKRQKTRIKCVLCNKECAGKLCFELHMKSHTGEKPEQCSVCGKAFAHKQYLEQHMRLHTGEKPFKCPVCNQGYAQRCNMKSHIKHNHKISQLSEAMVETLSKSKVNYLRFMRP